MLLLLLLLLLPLLLPHTEPHNHQGFSRRRPSPLAVAPPSRRPLSLPRPQTPIPLAQVPPPPPPPPHAAAAMPSPLLIAILIQGWSCSFSLPSWPPPFSLPSRSPPLSYAAVKRQQEKVTTTTFARRYSHLISLFFCAQSCFQRSFPQPQRLPP